MTCASTGRQVVEVPTPADYEARRRALLEGAQRRRGPSGRTQAEARPEQAGDRYLETLAADHPRAAMADFVRRHRPIPEGPVVQPQQDPYALEQADGGADSAVATGDGLEKVVGGWTSPVSTPAAAARPELIEMPAPITAVPIGMDCHGTDAPLRLPGSSGRDEDTVLATGCALGDLADVDTLVADYMRDAQVPNLSLAVVGGDGGLKLARGYTLQSAAPAEVALTTPFSRFRLHSVSKTITAIALQQVIHLSSDINLNSRVTDFVDISDAVHPEWVDELRVWHLLVHVTGWEKNHTSPWGDTHTPDPTLIDETIAWSLTGSLPIERRDIYTYVSRFLALDAFSATDAHGYMVRQPGLAYAYSNLGFMLAADLVQAVTGIAFETWVQAAIFDPIGAGSMDFHNSRVLMDKEVEYWDPDGSDAWPLDGARQPTAVNVRARIPVVPEIPVTEPVCVEGPYGSVHYEIRHGPSGVLGNVMDVAKLGWELSPKATPTVLTKGQRDWMVKDHLGEAIGGPVARGYGVWLDYLGGGTISHRGESPFGQTVFCVYPESIIWRYATAADGGVVAMLTNRTAPSGGSPVRSLFTDFLARIVNQDTGTTQSIPNISDWGAGSLWSLFASEPSWL